jgi:hypothetical protein
MKNPFDRTQDFDFDLPATDAGEDEDREALARSAHAKEKEEALVQKTRSRALTESRAFGILSEFVEGQRQATLDKLLLTVITDSNRDEMNYERGVVHGLMLTLKFAKAIAEGAEATVELFREQEKMNDAPRAN